MKPLSQQNYYEILDVPFDASVAVIAEAVDRAQALYAPGSLATYTLMDPEEEKLLVRLLEEARTTLLDPAARARYDERITGPDDSPASPGPQASPALEATIRAAWPELPPVVPAARRAADEGDDDRDDGWDEEPAATPAPRAPAVAAEPPVIAAVPHAAVAAPPQEPPAPAPPPSAAPTAPPRAPILLSREVALPPAAAPLATPPPAPAMSSAPVAAPVSTPAPSTTPVPGSAMPPLATLTPPPPAVVGPADGSWSGEVLRQIREARGISLPQISERTKVTRHHIENIEGDRYDQLPASVYLRGILLSIARELRLDGQKVARSYLERVTAAHAPPAPQGRR